MVLEFSTSIPRTQLRPGYGDGFLGAPLQTGAPSREAQPQQQGDRRGTSSTHPRQTLEVRITFEPSHISPACVVQAYERVVPIRRRPAPPSMLIPDR